jgi:peptidoglycan hydrolase-like protein with peptidoglycan-binding domain
VEGENYLLPVDAELERSIQLRSQAISLETILEDLSEARLESKVVILDCCRDNPLKRSWMNTRSVGRGLAPILDVNMPEASLVVYSADPGQVALDGNDGNSPFTKALANRLRQPGQNLLQAFLKTSDDVVDQTGGRQEPWVKMDAAGRAMRELVLVPEKAKTQPAGASPASVAKASKTGPAIPSPGVTSATAVGNGSSPAPLKKEDAGQLMKETPAPVAAPGEPAPAIGNTPDQPGEKPVVESKPLVLPDRGYYTNSEIFEGGPYSGYNSYSQKQILKSVQGKLSGAGTPDGVMGRKTQSALVSYQQANDIPVTGMLDAATLAAMGLAGLPRGELYRSGEEDLQQAQDLHVLPVPFDRKQLAELQSKQRKQQQPGLRNQPANAFPSTAGFPTRSRVSPDDEASQSGEILRGFQFRRRRQHLQTTHREERHVARA